MKTSFLAVSLLLLSPRLAMAHCPLCTIGAGGAALLAAYLGIGAAPVGVFVGAFALATGLWTARLIRKRFVRGQDKIIGAASFASVVFPVMPAMQQYSSLYVSWMGEYGRTFLVDNFLLGSVVGAAILYAAPHVSRKLARLRGNRMIPYQGMLMSLAMLLVAAGTLEYAL
jgi:hypothetical protein